MHGRLGNMADRHDDPFEPQYDNNWVPANRRQPAIHAIRPISMFITCFSSDILCIG